MPYEELVVKIDLCEALRLRPIFAVRMLPKSWAYEIVKAGGYAMILKYQLLPLDAQGSCAASAPGVWASGRCASRPRGGDHGPLREVARCDFARGFTEVFVNPLVRGGERPTSMNT
jgi:hypothetical protein